LAVWFVQKNRFKTVTDVKLIIKIIIIFLFITIFA